MPRPRRSVAQPNSLIASAAVLTNDRMVRPKDDGVAAWQQDAWHFYDTVGEFRFGCDWRAAACSRARLTIEEVSDTGVVTLEDGPEVDALAALFGGDAGQGQMLGTVALHFDVPGETYIVGEAVTDAAGSEADRWGIYSNEELTRDRASGRYKIDRGDGKAREMGDDAVVIRLWRSHPRKWVEATSPARAVLPVLRQIEGLNKHIAASIDSRLAGAGLLLLPSEMTFTPPPGVEVTPEQAAQVSSANYLLALLAEAMTTAIRDRDSVSAVAPIIAQAPGALLEHVKHLTFSTPFDERVQGLMSDYMRRLALGLDMPPEVLLGLGDSNHWSAWQIDESALKTSIEPTLEAITAGLTERWLYPAVEALAGRDAVNRTRRIGFDTSDLRLRPDRSAEARELHGRLILSDAALLRETGFDEGDLAGDDELRKRLLIATAGGVTTADVTMAALAELGVNLQPKPSEVATAEDPAAGGDGAPPAELPAPPEPETPPENRRELPEAAASEVAVLAAAELLVLRAVERANNRINRRGRRRPIPAEQLDAALVDAWDHAPRTAEHLGLDAEAFVAALDTYTRALLTTGEDHTPAVLTRCLTRG